MSKENDSVAGFSEIQKMIIRIRDNGQCQFPECLCGEDLEIHHIVPKNYAYFQLNWTSVEINSLKNGITLCRKHHKLIHKGYPKLVWNTEYDHFFKERVEKNTKKHHFEKTVCI